MSEREPIWGYHCPECIYGRLTETTANDPPRTYLCCGRCTYARPAGHERGLVKDVRHEPAEIER